MYQEPIPFTNNLTDLHTQFFVMLMLAIVGMKLPLLKNILLWFETFFHEISHALMTAFTFGRPSNLRLHWCGGGSVLCQGGLTTFILFAGYAGSTLWGTLIYLAGTYGSSEAGKTILYGLMVLIGLSIFFLVRNVSTFLILCLIAGVLLLPFYFSQSHFAPQILQFIGLSVGLNALRAPLRLINGKSEGDGAELARRTFIPEIIWVLLWTAIGLLGLFFMWQAPLSTIEKIFAFKY